MITHALSLADSLEEREIEPAQLALLDYFRSNAWDYRYAQRHGDASALWAFEQPELRNRIFYLRRAAHSSSFIALDPLRQCQILTNLGNVLNTVGRFVEARENWSAALAINSKFGMARGNRGIGLWHYAAALYDSGHSSVFALHAYRDLIEATTQSTNTRHIEDQQSAPVFSKLAAHIAKQYDIEKIAKGYNPDGWSLGTEPAEHAYRRWCLKNILFLNPLNDIEITSIAARDILTVPNFVTAIDESPVVVGIFNELKQSYVSARWMLWSGLQSREAHFSDREVLLYNTLDYPSYGLSTENTKMAFRLAYSLFDKIAYFLNYYLKLGVPEKKVSFRNIWREKEKGPVRDRFANAGNWPFRGLFWLSKDLFEEGMRDITEPDARDLSNLRNHLEHKYLKVHEMLSSSKKSSDPFGDNRAYSISRSDLEDKTLRIIKLVRSALIYLSLGMHREEQRRSSGNERLSVTMPLVPFDDEWKR